MRLAVRPPRVRLMLALLTADSVVIGALDLLVVIQWLIDTQPAVKARLEATLAERLQNR